MSYVDRIARLVEEHLHPSDRPGEHGEDLYRLYALLVLCRGASTSLEDVHDAWSVWMSGWKPTHPSLVPFEQLSPEKQAADEPFRQAILQASARLAGDGP